MLLIRIQSWMRPLKQSSWKFLIFRRGSSESEAEWPAQAHGITGTKAFFPISVLFRFYSLPYCVLKIIFDFYNATFLQLSYFDDINFEEKYHSLPCGETMKLPCFAVDLKMLFQVTEQFEFSLRLWLSAFCLEDSEQALTQERNQ